MNVLIATDGSDIASSLATHAGALLGEPTAVTVLAVVTEIPGDDALPERPGCDPPQDGEHEQARCPCGAPTTCQTASGAGWKGLKYSGSGSGGGRSAGLACG